MTPEHPHQEERIAERLRAERAVPRPGFRGDLRRRLLAADEAQARPPGIRRLITAYASAGTALVAIAAIGVAGVGPFGA